MTDEQIIGLAAQHAGSDGWMNGDQIMSFARALLSASKPAAPQKPYGWVGAGNYWTADELTAKQVSIRTDTPMVPVYVAPAAPSVEQDERGAFEQALSGMRNAFRVTETEGDSDPSKQRFHMRFTFRSMEELHAADEQWRVFASPSANAAAPAQSGTK